MSNILIIEVLLALIVSIIGGSLEWQVIRGNQLASQTNDSLEEIRRQQNSNSEILRLELTTLLNEISGNTEYIVDSERELRKSLAQLGLVLTDLRQVNVQLSARLELLDRKLDWGNGRSGYQENR